MRLRTIVLLVLLGNLVLLAGLHLATSRLVIYPGFLKIEKASAQRNLARCTDAIQRELYHLELITTDWAYWDDSYEFIRDLNEKYLESNLNDESFTANNVQLVYFLDTEGKIVWHRFYGLDGQFPDDSVQSVHTTVCGLSGEFLSSGIVKGMVSTDIAPLLLASCEIVDSNQSKPCRGRLVMGRFLTPTAVEELIRQTHVEFEMLPLDRDGAGIAEASGNTPVIEMERSKMHISSVCPDLRGRPAYRIRALQDRHISGAGQEVILFGFIVTLSTVTILAAILLYVLNRIVIEPIASLTVQIHDQRKNRMLHQPVSVSAGHEIQALAKEFNRLMRWLRWDRSKRIRTETLLAETARKAEQASHAKSEFLTNMSHELRTPMNAILGFTDLLLEESPNETHRDYLETLHRSSKSLLKLIDDLLDMSRLELGTLTINHRECRVQELTTSLAKFFQPFACQKNLDLKVVVSPEVPETFITDPLRLRQILVNLLSNAVKFTCQGRIGLTVDVSETPPHKHLCFTVEDSGIGIPRDRQKHLFGPFIQADSSTTRKYGGSGLGLAIASNLCELLGGTLQVESEPDQGSVFRVLLPLQPDCDCIHNETGPEPTACLL